MAQGGAATPGLAIMNFTTLLGLAIAAPLIAYLAARLTHRRRRAGSVDKLLGHPCQGGLHSLEPDQFAYLIHELFRREGRAPRRIGWASRHLMLARTADGTALVHCRFWTRALLGDNQLRQMARKMGKCGAHRGILVTAGEVTETLAGQAKAAGVEVLDGNCVVKRMTALQRRG